MRFFLIAALIFGVFQAHAAYEQADAIVTEHGRRTGVPVSRLVLPHNAQEAENRTQTSRFSGVSYKTLADIFLLPHPHIIDSIYYLMKPLFTDERASAVASCWFPSAGELIPNTVAINDPIGKLNVANQRDAQSKREATRRLGAFARILQDGITDGSVSVDDLVQRLLQAWGVSNPAQTKVFNDFTPEGFATEELKAAVLRGQAEIQKVIASYVRREGEHDQDENEIEQDPYLKRFHQALAEPNPQTAVVRAFLPGLLEQGFLQEGELEKGTAKFADKHLMFLRKRHVARLLAQLAVEEREAGRTADESVALAQLVTFAWKTTPSENMATFYAGFFGHELEEDEAAALIVPSNKLSLGQLLEKARAHPASFWELTFSQQQQLLGLDRGRRIFRLPTSGMARPFADQGSYSDCVESTGRGGVLEMLRNPVTGEMEPHLLPDTCPFKAYFLGYADERGRLSADGRDRWATETWNVPGVQRVKDKFGYVPSLENILLTYQRMMGDQEAVVLPITADTPVAEVVGRYRDFLARFSAWMTEHLGRPIQLSIEENDITLLRHENRTVGIIHIKNQPKATATGEDPLKEAGYLNVMAHHGDYEHSPEMPSSSHEEGNKDALPLVELVSPAASHVEEVLSILPWMTQHLMENLTSEAEQAAGARVQAHMGRYFPVLNFTDAPQLYGDVLKRAVMQGTPDDLTVVLKAGILSKFDANSRFIGLLLNDLLDQAEAVKPVKVEEAGVSAVGEEQAEAKKSLAIDARDLVRALVRRAPSLLHGEAPFRGYVAGKPSLLTSSILDMVLEWQDTDLLQEMGPHVRRLSFSFYQKTPRHSSDRYWATLAQLPEAFTQIGEMFFSNSHHIWENWTVDEQEKLRAKLPLFAAFNPQEINIWTLTPKMLEFFAPALSAQTTTLLYGEAIEYWNITEQRTSTHEEKVAANQMLRAKFAEMQAAGQLPATLKLKAQGELAALSRTK